MIKLKKVTVLNGTNHFPQDDIEENVELYTKEDLDLGIKTVTSIPNNYKVYFTDGVTFPRERLRQYGKTRNITIVRSPDKANIIVIDKNFLSREKELCLNRSSVILRENENGEFTMQRGRYYYRNPTGTFKQQLTLYEGSENWKEISDFYKLYNATDKIDVKDLNSLCNLDVKLDYESYTQLYTMLDSSDDETFNIGLSLFAACNHNEESAFYTWKIWNTFYHKMKISALWNNVSVRTLRTVIDNLPYRINGNATIHILRILVERNISFKIDRQIISIECERIINYFTDKVTSETEFFCELKINPEYELLETFKKHIVDETEKSSTIEGQEE